MNDDGLSRKERGYQRMRASMHLGMGAFYLLAGGFLIYGKYFGAIEFSETVAYALGALMVIYGIFRVWRGVQGLRVKL
jgi:hypothetical protein